ncbi:XkdQ/YqbQ family protein [Sporosarcina obsidiansis]|uniref:XkdQ/YqbQ family protein n=1 Tax=Sporosarcina obsidiansis TaxID=2660748 RepID=UPI00129C0C82|nr:phage portal protein [Sporosarcina obsidiansis]
MIELFLVKPDEVTEIPTESITWSGKRYSAARKIEARILIAPGTGRKVVRVEEGDTVLFKWFKEELFRGIVFGKNRTKGGMMTVIAYDIMQYLLINKTVRVFTKKRVDQIATALMKEFEIPIGSIVNTGHVMKVRTYKNETSLYDIILDGMIETLKSTSKRFRMYSQKGKFMLRPLALPDDIWVLETGVNIEDYSYSTSIEETATQVTMVAGEEKKQISVTVKDEEGKKKFGVLQYYEKVTDKVNKAQLKNRADQALKRKKGIQKELSIEARGNAGLVSGEPVRVIEKDLDINKIFYVDNDTHNFFGNRHTMSLKLIENNDIAEVS